MGSQETIPDDTLYPEYQNRALVKDNIVYPASEPAEPAQASKQSGDKKSEEQPGECTSRETKEAVSYTNARYKPEESGAEVVDILDEMKDLSRQLKLLSRKADNLLSGLQEALKQPTHKTLHMSGKLVRWADSTGTYGPNDDNHRPRKRARRKSSD